MLPRRSNLVLLFGDWAWWRKQIAMHLLFSFTCFPFRDQCSANAMLVSMKVLVMQVIDKCSPPMEELLRVLVRLDENPTFLHAAARQSCNPASLLANFGRCLAWSSRHARGLLQRRR